jgi:pimeloyl-ACP methyl ester carboxylesterase
MQFTVSILTILGIVYIVLCLVFYFFQELFFFRPEKLPEDFKYKYPFPYEEHIFEMEDGGIINSVHFTVPNSKGVIYYFKGNSRSIKGWGKFARDFVGKGYDFFIADYRGFGKSRGKKTQDIIYNDMQYVYKWLSGMYKEDNIIIAGRSLGSGIATRIASWNNPKMLILDSPYYSFLDQTKRFGFWMPIRWLLRYHIRTDQYIKNVKCPIFIFHGLKDWLIPISNSLRLKKENPSLIKLFTIEKAHHNNVNEFPEYHDFLYEVLNNDDLFGKMKKQIYEKNIK